MTAPGGLNGPGCPSTVVRTAGPPHGWSGAVRGPVAAVAALVAALVVLSPAAAVAAGPVAVGPVAAAVPAVPQPSGRVAAGERTATGRTVIEQGHVDMGPRFVAGRWTIQVRDDSVRPSVWRNLPDVVLRATDAAKVQVPDGPAYNFLGRPGSRVWLLPQVQASGILWPGWNTQDPEVATTVRREVTWRLDRVSGPGRFVLFLNGEFGRPEMVFDSAAGGPRETGIDVNTHVHGNWVFTAPGSYLIEVRMTAQTVDGRQVEDRQTLRMFVGRGDPSAAFAATLPAEPSPGASPAAAPAARPADRTGVGLPVTGGAGLLVVLAAGVWWLRRRRASAAWSPVAGSPAPGSSGSSGPAGSAASGAAGSTSDRAVEAGSGAGDGGPA